ncbi:MAG: hypothetical protein WCA19_13630 [Candidatus Acidiferrales bacterium]
MNTEFRQYRFARIEGQSITRARLEAQFKSGITGLDELEKAIAQQLAAAARSCAPWRKSEIEKTGCQDGMQMAALEFFWSHRQELRRADPGNSAKQNRTANA